MSEDRLLDAALAELRAAEHADGDLVAASGRVRRRVLGEVRRPFGRFAWRRIAAAMVVAGMLGAAVDLAVFDDGAAAVDLVMLDPLASIESE
jgi:hypothetical protein